MAHEVDVHVGKRIRYRRWLIGMTQQQLADKVGIKFQQIQKYETGTNRVSASRLWAISEAMEVHVSFFFEGLAAGHGDSAAFDMLSDKKALELVRSFNAMPENHRTRLFELAQVMSSATV